MSYYDNNFQNFRKLPHQNSLDLLPFLSYEAQKEGIIINFAPETFELPIGCGKTKLLPTK